MNQELRKSLLKTLAFHETWGHAPTLPEWIQTVESSESQVSSIEVKTVIDNLVASGTVIASLGRYVFSVGAGFKPALSIEALRANEIFAPRKLRRARRVARWLVRLSSVRFVALCNTTSLGHARDEGDLDFFVIARAGTLMQTRGLAALPFKLFGMRPEKTKQRDAVCLSYFVGDDGLDLASHMLAPDDPYFRYWFLSLLPLYDDGVSQNFWDANSAITSKHPFAKQWLVPPDLAVQRPPFTIPVAKFLEPATRWLQMGMFPSPIKDLMNGDTRVMVTDKVLKFHVDDRRAEYREKYNQTKGERSID